MYKGAFLNVKSTCPIEKRERKKRKKTPARYKTRSVYVMPVHWLSQGLFFKWGLGANFAPRHISADWAKPNIGQARTFLVGSKFSYGREKRFKKRSCGCSVYRNCNNHLNDIYIDWRQVNFDSLPASEYSFNTTLPPFLVCVCGGGGLMIWMAVGNWKDWKKLELLFQLFLFRRFLCLRGSLFKGWAWKSALNMECDCWSQLVAENLLWRIKIHHNLFCWTFGSHNSCRK
jgi:hypothetical protein